MKRVSALFFLAALSVAPLPASVIHVPGDQPTIQAAIDASTNGDTVLVGPGTYMENIDFHGKAISVESSNGAKKTIINGNQIAPVVTFSSSETSKSVLGGFTITQGYGNNARGGGIYCQNSSPTIRNNLITANVAAIGGGIEAFGGSPHILENIIINNSPAPTISGGWGGGISLENGSSAEVVGNLISGNLWNSNAGLGGGIALYNAGSPFLKNNVIYSNQANFGPGGGIWSVNSTPLIVQNLIIANTASFGGGVYMYLASATSSAIFVNNTFAENVGNSGSGIPGDGSAVYLVGYADEAQFFNNIFASSTGRESFYCGQIGVLPNLTDNDAFNSSGNGFGGSCAGIGGTKGNLSEDPRFVNPSRKNFHLKCSSPAAKAGDTSAPDLPDKDFRGKLRIVAGKIDMGVYEIQQ